VTEKYRDFWFNTVVIFVLNTFLHNELSAI